MKLWLAICALLSAACAADPPEPVDVADPTVDSGQGHGVSLGRIPDIDTPLEDILLWLAAELPARSPGTELAITVEDLETGERVTLDGDITHVSASSAKAWWVAAALDLAGTDAVDGYASAIFTSSDNSASGAVIDLIGPNAVNTWMWNVAGMSSSALTQWNFDKTRVASNSPRAMGGDNYMTADDAVTFLGRLYRKELLADERGALLLDWMKLSPNTGLGGWLPARLPSGVAVLAMHKAGWLPPGCCSSNAYYNTANDIGIIATPSGRAYAIAILARRGTDYWTSQVPFVELASCVIFRAVVQDDALACEG